MSVTLMRYKDGKQIPIKLSIWDAFKGAPIPKPRPHKCNSCGKLHRPVCKSQPQPAADKTETKKGKSKDGEKKDDSGFTAEEDARIKQIKAEDPSCAWTKVADALDNKHNKDACKARYKELQDAGKKDSSTDAKNDGEEKDNKGTGKRGGKKDSNEPEEQGSKQMNKKERKQAVREAGKKEAEAKKNEGQAVTEAAKPILETKPSPGSANDKQKWTAAAAKHFDRTGQRITIEQARKMAESAT